MRTAGSDVLWHAFNWFSLASWPFSSQFAFWHFIFRAKFCLVSNILCPSISRLSPRAISLNIEIIFASDQSEISSLSPIASPWVSDNPILNSILFSPSCDTDIVIKFNSAGLIFKNPTCVVDERCSNGNSTSDRSSLNDLVHHGLFSLNNAVFINSINFGFGLRPASFIGQAVLALDLSRTTNSIIMTKSLVRWTSFISDIVFMNPSIGISSITSTASFHLRISIARKENLRGYDDVRPLSFPLNLNSITEGRGSGKCPAWSTIYWNMLITLDGQVVDTINISPPIALW